jgi:hypothetical protein
VYYLVTMKYPDIVPALKYVKDVNARKELEKAFTSRCLVENTPILEQITALRHRTSPLSIILSILTLVFFPCSYFKPQNWLSCLAILHTVSSCWRLEWYPPSLLLVSFFLSFYSSRFTRLVLLVSFYSSRFTRLVLLVSFSSSPFTRLVLLVSFSSSRFTRLVLLVSFYSSRFLRLVFLVSLFSSLFASLASFCLIFLSLVLKASALYALPLIQHTSTPSLSFSF